MRTSLLIVACIGMISLLAGQDQAPKTLLFNGGFEQLDRGAPSGWELTSTGLVNFTVSNEGPREGKNCLRMVGESMLCFARSQKVSIDPAAGHSLTAHVRVASGNAIVLLSFFAGDKSLGNESSDITGTTQGWKALKCGSRPGAYPTATHVMAQLIGSAKMDVCYDEVSITPH